VDDINPDDNDGKVWVPVTAQTLNTRTAEENTGEENTGVAEENRAFPPMGPATLPRQMMMYVVQLNQDGLAEQASTPVLMSMQMPHMKGLVIIKANLGQGESPREGDMTAHEDGERKASKLRDLNEVPAAHCNKATKVQSKMPRTRQVHIPKWVEVIMSAMVRMVPCDWCQAKGHECLSQTKGGQPLNVCVGCHEQKLKQMGWEAGKGWPRCQMKKTQKAAQAMRE